MSEMQKKPIDRYYGKAHEVL
uniref:Uncharacterized protein n=1 Tax=Vitis vinifera TaxID=29760 RepID=F6HS13_VITVI